MYELDKVKTFENLDEDLKLSQELDASKKELEVAHANLSKDLKHLESDHNLLKKELANLRKNYDQLHASHMKTLATPSSPIIVDLNPCATNILCDQASLIEENKKLKAQLEKGLISCIQGEKNLNEVLNQQNVKSTQGGLGFNSSSIKKNIIPPRKINFIQEGYKENGVIGSATRGTPLTTTLRENITLPMCFVEARMAKFMLNMLVPAMVMLIGNMLFGFPRPL